MIHLCTCIGGSTSTFSSRKRRGGTTVSCKNCGGRPAIDGNSSSGCLLSTVLVLTSLINSDFTWTRISKGCRSSSRRPRKTTSHTITLACEELITKDSRDLEMPVSESEKLGLSVLGCRFSEKAEHIPIKKRRFVFKPSSPTHTIANPPLEDAERHETSAKLNSNANFLSATSEAFTEMCESRGKDHELYQNKLVKDDDFSGMSILAAAACSNSLGAETDQCEGFGTSTSVNHPVPKTIEFNENNVKKEPNSQISTTPSKVEESTSHAPLELALNKTNQEPNIQKSPTRDVRFSWDLNTVMDAWEEPFVNEQEISSSDAANDNASVEEKKKDYTKDNSGNLSVESKNLSHENVTLKADKYEPLSHGFEIAQNAVVVKTESMPDKHLDNASDDIPVTRTLAFEISTHGTFSKWPNLSGQSSGVFGSTPAVDTKLSIDCSIPPGFDHCFNSRVCKENVDPTIKHDLSLNSATCMENGPYQSDVTSNKFNEDLMKMELTSNDVAMEDMVNTEETKRPAAVSSIHDAAYSDSDNGVGYSNFRSDNRVGAGVDKVDEGLVGYDSQYEDGELRESAINAWKGYGLTEGQAEYDMNKTENRLNPSTADANETNSQNFEEKLTAIKESTELGSGKGADSTPNVVLAEKFHSSDEALSGSERNEMTSCQEKERQNIVQQHQHAASQSDEWKMNVSGWDLLPENQRSNSNNFTKTRNFTARKFSYREEQKDRFDTEDVEMKVESSRFSRKESITRIGGPSTRDVFLSRGRFQIDRCSSKDGDLASRSERESGALRSFGRGRYSPHNRPTGRGSGLWNHSPGRNRDGGGMSFHRSILEDSGTMDSMMNEGGMDLNDNGRHNTSSYVTRRPFRNRSPSSQEVNDFRARLGLRPTGDSDHERFVGLSRGRGRGRSMRYGTRLDGEGSRGRYHGPSSDECDDFMTEYSHPYPRSRRSFSPVERRNNNSYQHHQSDSRSPSRPRTRSPIGNSGFRRRSRSPGFRIRRPRSPIYRDHPIEYNPAPRNNNSSPPSSRWMNHKDRAIFNRSPPPGRADGERFSFYDSSRKQKQNEYYRSEHPGRFSDINEGGRGRPRYVGNDSDRPNNGYRRGGFVRRYNMDGPVKRFQYAEEDAYGRAFDARDRHVLELHARSNPNSNTKPCDDGTDSRFRDFPRRQREDSGDFKRRSRDVKDPKEESEHITNDFERRPKEVKDQPTTKLDSMNPNDVGNEGDNKPISGSN
ncbi:hypothetical protein R6Q59_011185 [Mikania micrantha]